MPEIVELPPLILHPFHGEAAAEDLLGASRAAMALHGLAPASEEEPALVRRLLLGRYQEIRMLLFLGKDLFRWLRQCVECLAVSGYPDSRITEQSFACLLVEEPPEHVRLRLEEWGVTDRRAIFSRAIGIHSILEDPPPFETFSPVFLRNYHRFADHAYICFQHLQAFLPLAPDQFQFGIYASEEYARKLSTEWERA